MNQPHKMNNIGEQLAARERNIELNTKDPVLRGGFTQVPNFILEDPRVGAGEVHTYSLFLKYAWDNDCVFPGQETLAKHMGCTDRTVRKCIRNLVDLGLIEVKRRGLGKTNLYTLNFVVKPKRSYRTRPENISDQDRKKLPL